MDVIAGRCWLYAIGRTSCLEPEALPDTGVYGAPVETLSLGDLAAVLSTVGHQRARSQTEAVTHRSVVDRLAAHRAVLPIRFGVGVDCTTTVVDELLAPQHAQLCSLLAQLDGRSQLCLHGYYPDDAPLPEAGGDRAEIDWLRERLRPGGGGNFYDRVRLAELVAEAVDRVRAADVEAVVDRLRPHTAAVEVLRPERRNVAVRLALLVERGGADEVARAVDDLSRGFGRRLSFDLSGPMAPWNFVGTGLVPIDTGVGGARWRW